MDFIEVFSSLLLKICLKCHKLSCCWLRSIFIKPVFKPFKSKKGCPNLRITRGYVRTSVAVQSFFVWNSETFFKRCTVNQCWEETLMEMTNDRVICANNAWLHNTVRGGWLMKQKRTLNVLWCVPKPLSYTQAFHEPIKKMSNQRENNYKKQFEK